MENNYQLFISYRRADSPGHAGRLSDALRIKFGDSNVFKDVSSIRGGSDFPSVIKNAIETSSVMVMIIGSNWLGKRFLRSSRISSPGDWIRKEIEIAYMLGKNILPVLVNKGTMPDRTELPRRLKFISDLNAVQLRDESWDMDLKYLYNELHTLSQAPPKILPVLTDYSDDGEGKRMKQKLIKFLLVTSLFVAILFTYFYILNRVDHSKKIDDGKLEVKFIQVNDVSEIGPQAGGKTGGLARLATLKKQLKVFNPNTFMIMSGNFLSPSLINNMKFRGQRIQGKQMIEAMNTAGFDLVTFGRHEFDLNLKELKDRINESQFQWISSNITYKDNNLVYPFKKIDSPIPKSYILNVSDSDGTKAKIGVIAITTPYNINEYIEYSDPVNTAKSVYNNLKDSCDAVIALTNQTIENDILLAKAVPGLSIIFGGMEIGKDIQKVGNVYIVKSPFRATSSYVVNLKIEKLGKKISVEPILQKIDETLKPDYVTNLVVDKWSSIISMTLAVEKFGISESEVVYNKEPLDTRDKEIRFKPTNFTKLLLEALKDANPNSDVVLFNVGHVRADAIMDTPLVVFDIFRSLPFGGNLSEVEMTGSLLLQILDQGRKNAGSGGFIHYNETVDYSVSEDIWKLNNLSIDPKATYRVTMPKFLLWGGEVNLSFINKDNPGIKKVFSPSLKKETDIRIILINYLKKQLN